VRYGHEWASRTSGLVEGVTEQRRAEQIALPATSGSGGGGRPRMDPCCGVATRPAACAARAQPATSTLVDLFDRLLLFTDADCERREADRSAREPTHSSSAGAGQDRRVRARRPRRPCTRQTGARLGDRALAADFDKVTHPTKGGGSRGAACRAIGGRSPAAPSLLHETSEHLAAPNDDRLQLRMACSAPDGRRSQTGPATGRSRDRCESSPRRG